MQPRLSTRLTGPVPMHLTPSMPSSAQFRTEMVRSWLSFANIEGDMVGRARGFVDIPRGQAVTNLVKLRRTEAEVIYLGPKRPASQRFDNRVCLKKFTSIGVFAQHAAIIYRHRCGAEH